MPLSQERQAAATSRSSIALHALSCAEQTSHSLFLVSEMQFPPLQWRRLTRLMALSQLAAPSQLSE